MLNISKKNIFFFILFFLFSSVFLFYWKYPFVVKNTKLEPLKFEEIIKKINIKNAKNLIKAENFIIQNNNIYGTLTALHLTKEYVLYNNLDKALLQLNNALKYTQEENLKNILKLNIAKIKIQKNENQTAINILESIQDHNWNNIIESMKGDIFMHTNDKKLAVKCWKKSLSLENSNASKEILNMKISEFNE